MATNKKKQASADEIVALEGGGLLEGMLESAGAVGAESRDRVSSLYRELIGELTKGMTVRKGFTKTVNEHIAAIDEKVSQQLSAILHHAKFQRLEASWRGLHKFVKDTETGENQRIEVLDCSKNELLRDFQQSPEFTESALFKKVYQGGFGQAGADPFGMIVGDFEFNKGSEDMELLTQLSGVAAGAHAPLITAGAAGMFGMDSFSQLPNPRDLAKAFDKNNPENIKWNAFRETEDSRYVGLCIPHVLARAPYGKDNKIDEFDFQEDVDGEDHDKYLWGNASYSFAGRVTAAFAKHRWCVAIRGVMGGGKVEGLPIHTFKSREGAVSSKCPTEVLIPDTRENELSKLGFLALANYKNTDFAVFFGGCSSQKPKEYNDNDATASAFLSAQLPYLFAVSRIAHYLKVMCRDRVGSFMSKTECQKFLETWISQYVLLQDDADQDKKARFPLREASIQVEADPAKPGSYQAVAHLKPHFQLENLKVSLRLVASIPQRK
jgi:type VI secretion system protein ImpC